MDGSGQHLNYSTVQLDMMRGWIQIGLIDGWILDQYEYEPIMFDTWMDWEDGCVGKWIDDSLRAC